MTTQEIVNSAVKALDDKKARNIVVMDVRELTTLGDYFVVASGNSTTQVKAMAGEVNFLLKKKGLEPKHIEQGERASQWTLLDYGDVLVHIFLQETREFYNLERLWADAPTQNVELILENYKDEKEVV